MNCKKCDGFMQFERIDTSDTSLPIYDMKCVNCGNYLNKPIKNNEIDKNLFKDEKIDGRSLSKNKICERCGKKYYGLGNKYCKDCQVPIYREQQRLRRQLQKNTLNKLQGMSVYDCSDTSLSYKNRLKEN